MTEKKVWCLFEESEHIRFQDQFLDGRFLTGVYRSQERALEAMTRRIGWHNKSRDASLQEVVENDEGLIVTNEYLDAEHTELSETWTWEVEERILE